MATTVLHSAQLLDAAGSRHDGWLALSGGTIAHVGSGLDWKALEPTEAIDLHGATVMPGVVDIHHHGVAGVDWGTASAHDAQRAMEAHRDLGTATVVASLATNDWDLTVAALDRVRDYSAQHPRLWGVHLEGPFLAPRRRGAHPEHLLLEPTPDMVATVCDYADVVRQITVAPELYGALQAIDRWVDAGIVVAIGHTDATADVCHEAFARGASVVTHAFNGMRGIAARDIGPVGAALRHSHVTLEVIADGVHVDPSVIAMLFAAAPGRIALVSDALPAMGMPEGDYGFAATSVSVHNDRATVTGTETIAGSVAPVLTGVATVVRASVPARDAVAAATTTPAAALGRDPHQHRLVEGAPGPVLVVNDDWTVRRVFG